VWITGPSHYNGNFNLIKITWDYTVHLIAKHWSIVEISIISTALMDEAGQISAIVTTERAREKKEEILP